MDIQKIKELALANGFKLKEQADGSMDLNAYVYDFANAIEQAAKAHEAEKLKGCVVVPVEPTKVMYEAYARHSVAPMSTLSKTGYKAMLEAARGGNE